MTSPYPPPGFVNYKKGALDSQPQVIKFTSCLPRIGGSLDSSTTKTGHHDLAEILLKVALNTKNQNQSIHTHLNGFKVPTYYEGSRFLSRISFPNKPASQDMADKLLKMSINIDNINSTYIK